MLDGRLEFAGEEGSRVSACSLELVGPRTTLRRAVLKDTSLEGVAVEGTVGSEIVNAVLADCRVTLDSKGGRSSMKDCDCDGGRLELADGILRGCNIVGTEVALRGACFVDSLNLSACACELDGTSHRRGRAQRCHFDGVELAVTCAEIVDSTFCEGMVELRGVELKGCTFAENDVEVASSEAGMTVAKDCELKGGALVVDGARFDRCKIGASSARFRNVTMQAGTVGGAVDTDRATLWLAGAKFSKMSVEYATVKLGNWRGTVGVERSVEGAH